MSKRHGRARAMKLATERLAGIGVNLADVKSIAHVGPCQDCGAVPTTVDGKPHLQHLETCPAGLALESASDLDREYFKEHPDEVKYTRPMRPMEFGDLGVEPAPFGMRWMVDVTVVGPGLRARRTRLERIL